MGGYGRSASVMSGNTPGRAQSFARPASKAISDWSNQSWFKRVPVRPASRAISDWSNQSWFKRVPVQVPRTKLVKACTGAIKRCFLTIPVPSPITSTLNP